MGMNVWKHFGAAGAFALLMTSTAQATPVQGSVGSSSTGSVTITASVPSRVQISKLSDVTFANQDPTTAASNNQDICVWSNTGTKGYNITATGNNGGGTGTAFTLGGTGLTAVPYTVEWSATSGQTSGTALTTATALGSLTSTATTPGCTSGAATTASLIVKMSTTALQAMKSGTNYTGTLTLVVAPE